MKLEDGALARARELCDAATPGPWSNRNNIATYDSRSNIVTGPDLLEIVVEKPGSFFSAWKDDAEFIAAARTLLPLLLDVAEAAAALRMCQKDYMLHRGDNERGHLVGVASEIVDMRIAALEAAAPDTGAGGDEQ